MQAVFQRGIISIIALSPTEALGLFRAPPSSTNANPMFLHRRFFMKLLLKLYNTFKYFAAQLYNYMVELN